MKLCLGQLTSNHPQLCKLIHGVSNFGKKFASLLHGMRLDHFTDKSLAYLIREIVSLMNDYGVEHLLRTLVPVSIRSVLQVFRDTDGIDIDVMVSNAIGD